MKPLVKRVGAWVLVWVFSVPGLGAAPTKVEQARQEAEMYAKRSDDYRNRPARALSAEEAQAKKIMDEAAALLGEADTEAQTAQAAGMFKQATELAPQYDEAWSGLGNAYFIQGLNLPLKTAKEKKLKLYTQAREACAQARALDPQSPAANLCLANLLLAEGEVKGMVASAWVLPEVFKLSDRIAAVDPYYDDGAIFRTFAVVLCAVPAWLSRSFGYTPEVILPYLDQAISRQPRRFSNYLVRADIYQKLGQRDSALDDLAYLLSHDPAAAPELQRENRRQQAQALPRWQKLAGRDYPARP